MEGVPLPTWTPELATLDLLLSVAELGSVGKAAAAHGITQPAASTRLDRLERRTGLALLTRTPTGSTLTPTGAAFVAWAREVVLAADALTANVLALRDTRSARLRVAASLTIAEYLLPVWLLTLRRQDPDLEVTVIVANSHDVADRVRGGTADLGFVESPAAPAGLGAQQVGVDRLVLVAAPSYPAAARATTVPADLVDAVVLLREPGSGTRETFVDALTRAVEREPDLHHSVQLGSTATILATARAGGGVGVISERAARADLAAGSLVEIVVDGVDARRPLNAVWSGRTAGPAARVLVELAARAAL